MATCRSSTAFVLICVGVLVARVGAQHIPTAGIRSRPEHTLCGIDVTKTAVKTLIKRFGLPRVEATQELTDGPIATHYSWQVAQLDLIAGTYTYHSARGVESHVAIVLLLSRSPGTRGTCATGAGLTIGDSEQRIHELYRAADRVGENDWELTWKDGTVLMVHVDSRRRITDLRLFGPDAE